MSKLFLSIFFTLCVAVSFSQSFNRQKMDSFLNRLVEKDKSMGSLAISKHGKVIYSKAVGFASMKEGEKIQASEKTKYRIGSITKMFTGVIIMQLVEEKKLSLGETLAKHFPGIPNAAKITVGNLLNHRSGIHNLTNDTAYPTYQYLPKSQKEIIDIISKPAPDFEPGSKADYSNSNYILLGYLAEKITKKSFDKLVKERIAKKLDLKDTYVGSAADLKNNESLSYSYSTGWQVEAQTDMSIPGAAGAMLSTPSDLVRFISGLFSGKLISMASLEKMKKMEDKYGMAMFQIPFYKKIAYGHYGGIDAFSSTLGYFPADSMAFSYITNGSVYPTNDVVIGALSIYFNEPFVIPSFETKVVSEKDLLQYIGNYSSKQMPLKITVTTDGKSLMAQATNQSAFPLDAKGNHIFSFDQAGIVMEFNPMKNELTLKQGGGTFLFKKD